MSSSKSGTHVAFPPPSVPTASSAAIVGLGHDLQLLDELRGRPGLAEADVMFTAAELRWAERATTRERALATLLCAKEAFFKAIPVQTGWHWCELELQHTPGGRPEFAFGGALAALMEKARWSAKLSISHSGAYASSVVLIQRSE